MASKPSAWLAALALVAVALNGCATLGPRLQPPRLSLVNLQLTQATLFEQRFALQVRVQNTNDRALEVRGFSFDLDVNGQQLASGVSNRAFSVPAFGETVTAVFATTTLTALVRQLAQLDRAQRFRYRLRGKIQLAGFSGSLPFEYKGEVPIVPPTAPAQAPAGI